MSIMKQKQYEVPAKDFHTHKLPMIPAPYFWKFWCNRSVAFLELRKKGRFFSVVVKGTSITARDFDSMLDMAEKTAYHLITEYIDTQEKK